MRRWALLLLGVAALGGFWWWARPTPAERLREGRAALHAGETARVETLCKELQDDGLLDHAHLLRGESRLQAHRYMAALEEFNRVEEPGGLRVEAAALAGRCLLALDNRAEAARAFSWVLSQDTENADAHRGLGALAYDQGEMMRAIHHLTEAARIDATDGRPHRLIGLIRKDMGQRDDAVAAYREALQRDLPTTDRRAVKLELAEVQLKRKDHESALQALDGLDAYDSMRADAQALRAEALLGLAKTDLAVSFLDMGIRKFPKDGRLLRLRGQAYVTAGDAKEAAPLLERAIAADPHDHQAHHQLALAYAALDRPADAEKERQRVREIHDDLTRMTELQKQAMERPRDAAVRRQLAALCRKLDKPELAASWEKAAAACPPAESGASSP